MISRTYSDGDLESIVRLVTVLAGELLATAPVAQQLAACGLVLDETLEDEGAADVVRFAATALGLDGNGTVTDGSLSAAAVFVAESRPPDRDAIREVNDRLSRLFAAQWGPPELDPSDGAPQSTWQADNLTVSLDCIWANGEIGLIMISIEPTERADAGR